MADQFFSSVSLLLHCDGSNGSTTFVDSSAAALTVTATGNAQISTAAPKFGSGAMSNSTGGLSVPSGANFAMAAGNFCFEGWAKPAAGAGAGVLLSGANAAGTDIAGVYAVWDPDFGLDFRAYPTVTSSTISELSATAPPREIWFHWAFTRSGNVFRLFVDGVNVASQTVAGTLGAPTTVKVSNYYAGDFPFIGDVDDVRITKGQARYTANFTPPVQAFSNSALGLDSTQNKNTGAASGSAQQPTLVGALASTQALNTGLSTGTADQPAVMASTQQPNTAATQGQLTVSGAAARAQAQNSSNIVANRSSSGSAAQTIQPFNRVAYMNGGSVEPVDSFFQSTVLLLHMDAGFSSLLAYDSSANPKVPASSSGVSISQSASSSGLGVSITPKFGAGMLSVTGSATTQGLIYNHPDDFDMGVGDFTVEGWVYLTGANSTLVNLGASLVLFEGRNDSGVAGPRVTASAQTGVAGSPIFISSTFAGVSSTVSGGAASAGVRGAWVHWAFTRQGGTFRTFAGGVLGSSNTVASTSKPTTSARLGAAVADLDPAGFSYFDDVRVTKGAARYTTSFAVPTEAFPDRGTLPELSAAAAQTVAPLVQDATIYGAGFRSAVAAQTLLPFPQTYLVSPPSRVAESSTTFVFEQAATVHNYWDRNIVQGGDNFYDDVAYLLHADVVTADAAPPYTFSTTFTHLDSGPLSLPNLVGKGSFPILDAGALGGKAVGFSPGGNGGYIAHTSYFYGGGPRAGTDQTKRTLEMRVRFDDLTEILSASPVVGSPGSYQVDDITLQKTGWFFVDWAGNAKLGVSGNGGNTSPDFQQYNPELIANGDGSYSADFGSYRLTMAERGSPGYEHSGSTNLTTGWHTIAVVQDGLAVQVFLDGVLDISYTLPVGLGTFSGIFVTGSDVTGGFAPDESHMPLSALEELRFTWGAVRYTGNYAPSTFPFPEINGSLILPFTQTATVVHYVGPRQVVGTQTLPAFFQNAQASTQPARQAVGAQTLPAFGQSAQASGVPIRVLGATQLMAPFANAGSFSTPRAAAATQAGDPFVQAAEVTTTITAVASQALVVGQIATAVHANIGAASATSFVFAQAATAKALLALTEGQIVLPFGQGATAATTAKLTGAQLVQPFLLSTLVEGAYIPVSIRGYRVRPEARTITHS